MAARYEKDHSFHSQGTKGKLLRTKNIYVRYASDEYNKMLHSQISCFKDQSRTIYD